MEHLIAVYGYVVITVGTFFEGETILLIGAFLAHQKYLNIRMVILAAFAGSFAGDQLYYFIGRSGKGSISKRFIKFQDRIERFQQLLNRHDILVILAFRFIYGLRTVAPFAIGMSGIPVFKFFILNFISALLWAAVVGLLGFYFGHTVELVLGEIKRVEIALSAVIVFIITVYIIKKIIRSMNLKNN